jgi:hypothetical protein
LFKATDLNLVSYYSPTLFRALRITDVALYTGIYGLCRSAAAIAFYAFIVSNIALNPDLSSC